MSGALPGHLLNRIYETCMGSVNMVADPEPPDPMEGMEAAF